MIVEPGVHVPPPQPLPEAVVASWAAFIVHRIESLPVIRRESPCVSFSGVMLWWELRRIPYNLIVGQTGVVSGLVMFTTAFISERVTGDAIGLPDPAIFAIFGVIMYGIGANVCYTGGWITELFVRRLWPGKSDRFASWAFAFGLIFSVALTLLPALLTLFFAAIAIFGRATGHAPVKVDPYGCS